TLQGDISGEDVSVIVNFKYISDGLSAIATPKVKLFMNDPMSPILILPEGGEAAYRYLVMPIRQ
ncbi:MAG: DNA polymerase III subunit beta, partial [Thermoanaerobaculia bacterium]|nr:DNA polymerase III subunit beta [Thermoanaerobaculia bacterium]